MPDRIIVVRGYEIIEEDLSTFSARGRDLNCACGQIQCVCSHVKGHKVKCKFRVSTLCAVPIECEHGFDVCPQCDPCTCGSLPKTRPGKRNKRVADKTLWDHLR